MSAAAGSGGGGAHPGPEVVIRPYLPVGPVGLLAAGVPALVGLGVFGVLMLGPRRVLRIVAKPRISGDGVARLGNAVAKSLSRRRTCRRSTSPSTARCGLPSLPEVPST